MTLAEKGLLSAEVVLTGFVVVFSVLIMLIVLIGIYGGIVSVAEKTAKKKQTKSDVVKTSEPVATPVAPVDQINGVSDEVVAVISAAVYSMYGSTKNVRIKSIKKTNGGRSAWANAGVLNNTRPF